MALWHQSSLSHLVSWVVQESTRARILCCIAANASNGQAVADNQCICRHVRLCQCHLWKGCCNLQLLGRKVYWLNLTSLFLRIGAISTEAPGMCCENRLDSEKAAKVFMSHGVSRDGSVSPPNLLFQTALRS